MNDTERHSHSLRQFRRDDGAHGPHFGALPSRFDVAEHVVTDSESLVAQILDAIKHPVAVCDARAVVLGCNSTWREFGESSGLTWPWVAIGQSLLDALSLGAREGSSSVVEFARGIQAVVNGEQHSHSAEFQCTTLPNSRSFQISATALHHVGEAKLIVTCDESTARNLSARESVSNDHTTVDRSQLSLREQQILDLVLAGEPNKSIAVILDLSQKTVEKHRSSLMRKLGVQNVVQLVRKVLGHSQSQRP